MLRVQRLNYLLLVKSKSTTAVAENFISIFDMDATAIGTPKRPGVPKQWTTMDHTKCPSTLVFSCGQLEHLVKETSTLGISPSSNKSVQVQ